ncbi:MAG: aminoglycoside phosphotransferase family protein [Clostridiales bacterium]|jgi:serine/threonine protein kinase|nr:aminoglycoside phosphotransferase family protein [Clostridiales bacterium]
MPLFNEKISCWDDWGRVFQSTTAFRPLVEYILEKENLPVCEITNLTPGTNGVFRVGKYVIKIFAPLESGIDQTPDLKTELFATRRANEMGISSPKLIANGYIDDKYHFAYMITEYIEGAEFSKAVLKMTSGEKVEAAKKLRHITDKMNTPCKAFNQIDVINDTGHYRRWEKFPDNFKTQRLEYIKSMDCKNKVFVHGDLCGDNIIITPGGNLYIIDFADAVLAPLSYEHSLVAVELFDFDSWLIKGYFEGYTPKEITGICFEGLLIHDFGGDIVVNHLGNNEEFQSLEDLHKRLEQKIQNAFF